MYYDLLRAAHVIAVIAWVAGLLMLPRLLVYRLEGSGDSELRVAMDRAAIRLQRIILTPSMAASWLFGLALLALRFGVSGLAGWMWAKLALVVALTYVHAKFTVWRRRVAAGEEPVSARTLRLMNEIPFVAVILIVALAVLEPGFA